MSAFRSRLHGAQLAPVFQFCLQESPDEARVLAIQWLKQRRRSRRRWDALAGADPQTTLRQAQSIRIHDLLTLGLFLNRFCERGLVLATIHMGDYLHATLALLQQCAPRPILIVRQKNAGNIEAKAFGQLAALGFDFDVVRTGEKTAGLRILKGLKKGAVVVMLYDLPASFGETTPVKIFDQTLHWVSGPVQAASLARALIVPYVCFEMDDGFCCDLLPIHDMQQEKSRTAVTQALVTAAEKYIRRFPDQWLQWNQIPHMGSASE